MKILITCSRMPYSLDEIRKLGSMGHQIFTADTFKQALGNYSKYVNKSFVIAAPKLATEQFIEDLLQIVNKYKIDILVPTSEEVFYIAKYRDSFPKTLHLPFPDFATLAKLHNKVSFAEFAQQLNILTPKTVIAKNKTEFNQSIAQFSKYIARSAYSRAGLNVLTNDLDLAQYNSLDETQISESNPWLVQEFIEGIDICTYSIAHQGKITAHCTYEHPHILKHTGGISFESVAGHETLAVVEKIIKVTNYSGQIAFDFRKNEQGLFIIECNPRATHGVTLMTDAAFTTSLLDPASQLTMVKPGIYKQIYLVVLKELIRRRMSIMTIIKALLNFKNDLIFQKRDLKPGFYMFKTLNIVRRYRKQKNRRKEDNDIVASQFYDTSWDGEV